MQGVPPGIFHGLTEGPGTAWDGKAFSHKRRLGAPGPTLLILCGVDRDSMDLAGTVGWADRGILCTAWGIFRGENTYIHSGRKGASAALAIGGDPDPSRMPIRWGLSLPGATLFAGGNQHAAIAHFSHSVLEKEKPNEGFQHEKKRVTEWIFVLR